MMHSATWKSRAMSKKQRWENEDAGFSNPFAALKPAGSESAKSPETPAAVKKEPKLPKAKSARIERAHRGGKTVTIVYFHGTPDDEAKSAWLKQAKTTLGIGGQVEEDHVYLQGEQLDRLKTAGFLKSN